MTCGRRYPSQAAADSAVFTMRARQHELADRLEVKSCEVCKGFHLRRKEGPAPRPVIVPYNPTRRVALPYKESED